MIKKISIYLLAFLLLCVVGYKLHTFFLSYTQQKLQFNLWNVYVFNAVFSANLCVLFLIIYNIKQKAANLGFLYLGTLFFKIISFYAVFQESIFNLKKITKFESATLLISIGVFLVLEVFFISKILNEKGTKIIKPKK